MEAFETCFTIGTTIALFDSVLVRLGGGDDIAAVP